EQPNRNLEILNRDIFIERQILDDVFASRVRFVIQTHQDHRVERVDRRHQKRLGIPIVISLAEWLQVVVAPRVLLVTSPRVQKFRTNLSRELCLVNSLLMSGQRGSNRRDQQKTDEPVCESSPGTDARAVEILESNHHVIFSTRSEYKSEPPETPFQLAI